MPINLGSGLWPMQNHQCSFSHELSINEDARWQIKFLKSLNKAASANELKSYANYIVRHLVSQELELVILAFYYYTIICDIYFKWNLLWKLHKILIRKTSKHWILPMVMINCICNPINIYWCKKMYRMELCSQQSYRNTRTFKRRIFYVDACPHLDPLCRTVSQILLASTGRRMLSDLHFK